MLLLALAIGLLQTSAFGSAAPPHWPRAQEHAAQVASYRMDVRLDPATKSVAGVERITYRNPSQDTLGELWLRLYLRAFRSLDTLWMRESGGVSRGINVDPAHLGDITVSKLALADGTDLLASATLTDTLMRVPLPHPLPPGQSAELDVSWVSKLPRVFARTGYGGRNDTFFMVGQWYPKMAVYDRGRWDTEPWHANSEFFNDFGSYDVSITLPKEYVVAGAGVPAGEQAQAGGAKTLRFTADDVTDFAFAASPDFRTHTARAGDVDVVLYDMPEHESLAAEYLEAAVGSLQAYSAWYGAYPHPRLTVVDVPDDASGAGGMEYPTLVTGDTLGVPVRTGIVAYVVSHEIGHQWWPMQTATNEGREPWLDEGLTEYSGARYMAESGHRLGIDGASVGTEAFERALYGMMPDRPVTLPAWQYGGDYDEVYSKTAIGLWTLERVVGTERFRHAMAEYLARYRFKHPNGADFRSSLERSLGGDLSWFFDDYLAGTGRIDYAAGSIDNNPDGPSVWVARQGSVRAPVEVAVTLAGGERKTMTWDGHGQITRFRFAPGAQVVSVEVDPQRKLAAEVNVLDNGVTLQPSSGPALTFGGRLVFWFQALVQSVGLFG